jgi:uncharacterized protein involved in exopolysaccharide biosynthesis
MSQLPPASFSFPLPFDPLRLLYGIRERWYWFLLLPLALGAIGYFAGTWMAENRYSVSLQLIKNEVPTTLQMSEAGQSFRPRDLSDDTLLATTYSTDVLRRTGERLVPRRPPAAVKSMVQIDKQRNTSLFYLTAHSRVGADDAVTTVATWADEIIRFTDNLQRQEARVMQQFLGEQYNNLQRQLAANNRAILDFSREHQFIDVEAQTEVAIRSLEDIRLQLLYAVLQRDSLTIQIQRYRDELRVQSPLAADLRKKREELTYLRGRYTDINPMVQEKLFEITYIEQQIAEAATSNLDDLKQFTGSELGNNLYLEILALENERVATIQRIAGMEELLATRTAAFSDLPEKSLGLSELRSRRDQLLTAIALIDGRRREAAFYETNAPGYWRIFQNPSANEVHYSSQNMKAVLLALAGGVSGLFLALFLAAIWEYSQPGLRTVLEAALVTRTRPVLRFSLPPRDGYSWWCQKLFPHDPGRYNAQRLHAFWIVQSLRLRDASLPGLLFVVTGPCSRELLFWESLLQAVSSDGQQVVFFDLEQGGGDALSSLRTNPAICAWHSAPHTLEPHTPALAVVRVDQLTHGRHVAWLKSFGPYFWLSAPNEADRHQTRELTGLVHAVLGPAAGLIVIDQSSGRTIARTLATLESMTLQFQSKSPADSSAANPAF